MQNTTVSYGVRNSLVARWLPFSPKTWTWIGALAIPLWATWPALGLRSLEIPAFECQAIAFFCGWVVLANLERSTRDAAVTLPSFKSWIPAVVFALGETGSGVFHLFATHYIPAAEANLICYLWPVEVVAIAAALGLFKLRARQVIGLLLGLTGAAILVGSRSVAFSYIGIIFAFFSGLSWTFYCVFRLRWATADSHVVSRGLALSALICTVVHFATEPSIRPSLGGLASAAAVGVVPAALGNWVWDQGFRRGDSQLLAVMAYATPLCGAVLLAVLGLEVFTFRLLIGGLVIVSAGMLSRT